jgi:GDP-D-mannose dehydratase
VENASVRPTDDFVVASGVAHSLEEFVAMAFLEVGLNLRDHVDYDCSLVRPNDIMCSLGDPTKAAQLLDWCPTIKWPESGSDDSRGAGGRRHSLVPQTRQHEKRKGGK